MSISYTKINGETEELKSDQACFYHLSSTNGYANPPLNQECILYHCRLEVDQAIADKWIEFLVDWFGDDKIIYTDTYTLNIYGEPKNHIDFYVNTDGMAYKKYLTILTAIRYIHEFPDLTKAFVGIVEEAQGSSGVELSTSDKFNILMDIHWGGKNNTNSNHALAYKSKANAGDEFPYCDLEGFHQNMADPNVIDIFPHFYKRIKK